MTRHPRHHASSTPTRTMLLVYGIVAAMVVSLVILLVSPAVSWELPDAAGRGWELEHDDRASYAAIKPTRTNVNVDSVVLACGEIHRRRGVQMELYLSTSGPLLPKGAAIDDLNKVPRAEIVIDGQSFGMDLLFADVFVVVAERDGDGTLLSDRLLEALERGRSMTIRFDLLADQADQLSEFDGELVVDLQAGQGGAAVAAVRRCGEPQLSAERR